MWTEYVSPAIVYDFAHLSLFFVGFCSYSSNGVEDTQGIFGVDLKHSSTDDVPEVLRACADAVQARGMPSTLQHIDMDPR
jgi:hypothetical protein